MSQPTAHKIAECCKEAPCTLCGLTMERKTQIVYLNNNPHRKAHLACAELGVIPTYFETKEPRTMSTQTVPAAHGDLAQMIASYVAPHVQFSADQMAAQIDEKVAAAVANMPARTIEIKVADKAPIVIDRQHRTFEDLLQTLASGLNVWLVGPAGSGKTTAAEKAAEALGIAFFCQSVGLQTTKSDLLGYMDATGRYVTTSFRRAYEEGGVFCLDEVDAGNPNVLTVLNSALSNGYCSFPDGMIKRSENCRVVAAGNTWGTGANRQYVGRNPIDGATLDRFAMIEWAYDEEFEMDLCSNKGWCTYVQKVRKSVAELSIQHIVSPRASLHGARLLSNGMPRNKVEEMVIWKGMDKDSRTKVEAKAAA